MVAGGTVAIGVALVAGTTASQAADEQSASGSTTLSPGISSAFGGFRVANLAVSGFPVWAREAGYQLVAGDFNADGRDDLAISGAESATTIPAAFCT